MTVDIASAKHTHEHDGQTYYFCADRCRSRFVADPDRFLDPEARQQAAQAEQLGGLLGARGESALAVGAEPLGEDVLALLFAADRLDHLLDELPRTSVGKIRKFMLKESVMQECAK